MEIQPKSVKKKSNDKSNDTADGGNPANQLMLVVFPCFPILYKVLYIPGGAGVLPSTVVLKTDWNNQLNFWQLISNKS